MSVSVLNTVDRSISNCGIGLRHCHLREVLERKPAVPWFEVLADNHLEEGGATRKALFAIREAYPFTFHCVNMSLGSTDELNFEYLKTIKRLMHELQPAWVSDHVCFTHVGQRYVHELLPLPYTEEALKHMAARIQIVQEFLGQRILIENISSYLTYSHSTISEGEFLGALADMADCDILLDVNNIYVNSINHQLDVREFLTAVPMSRVREIHLAGFEDRQEYLLDAHNNCVADAVWNLFSDIMQIASDIPALIEWDNDIPALSVLQQEAGRADYLRYAHKPVELPEQEMMV